MPKCPYCGDLSFEVKNLEYNLPYLGRVVLISMKCGKCGFSRVELMPLEVKEPIKITLKASLRKDYNIKIVRSPTARLKVPELGVEIDPGPLTQTYITNLEGIVKRLREIGKTFLALMSSEGRKTNVIKRYLEKVKRMEDGEPFTLIIEDPAGISKVVGGGQKVKIERLNNYKG